MLEKKSCLGEGSKGRWALTPSHHISIIIPTLNEEERLDQVLEGLSPASGVEVIVVDGGSCDDTGRVAGAFPHVRLLESPMGRGLQMNAGALAAGGKLLVFLHADTFLRAPHLRTLLRLAPDKAFQAGAFEFALAPELPALKFIASGVNLRCRVFGLPYGDQALTVRRDLFFRLGGYAHRWPEDLDLVLRLRRLTRLRLLKPALPTSARRWLQTGYMHLTLRNWLHLAFHLSQRTLTRRWPALGEIAKVGG